MFLLSSRTIYNTFRDFQCLVIKACLMHKTPYLWQEDEPHAAYYKDCRKDLITEDSHICLEPDVPVAWRKRYFESSPHAKNPLEDSSL